MNAPVVAIVQARMGSTRLPGKVLSDICGKPMLLRVVERVQASKLIDKVVVAATVNQSDEQIGRFCADTGIDCFRGSEQDVLDRYHQCACWVGAATIVRITADCPLLDPLVIDLVVSAYLESEVDYASNRRYNDGLVTSVYPDGLDTEAFSLATLERAWREARLASEREHVTPYIWKRPSDFRTLSIGPDQDLSALRWTVDEEADLDFVRAVYRRLGDRPFGMHEVLNLLRKEPRLAGMNAHIPLNEGYMKSLRTDSDSLAWAPHSRLDNLNVTRKGIDDGD